MKQFITFLSLTLLTSCLYSKKEVLQGNRFAIEENNSLETSSDDDLKLLTVFHGHDIKLPIQWSVENQNNNTVTLKRKDDIDLRGQSSKLSISRIKFVDAFKWEDILSISGLIAGLYYHHTIGESHFIFKPYYAILNFVTSKVSDDILGIRDRAYLYFMYDEIYIINYSTSSLSGGLPDVKKFLNTFLNSNKHKKLQNMGKLYNFRDVKLSAYMEKNFLKDLFPNFKPDPATIDKHQLCRIVSTRKKSNIAKIAGDFYHDEHELSQINYARINQLVELNDWFNERYYKTIPEYKEKCYPVLSNRGENPYVESFNEYGANISDTDSLFQSFTFKDHNGQVLGRFLLPESLDGYNSETPINLGKFNLSLNENNKLEIKIEDLANPSQVNSQTKQEGEWILTLKAIDNNHIHILCNKTKKLVFESCFGDTLPLEKGSYNILNLNNYNNEMHRSATIDKKEIFTL